MITEAFLRLALEGMKRVFCSEADFQHALAWQLHLSGFEPRVEWPHRDPESGKNAHIDIWVPGGDGAVAIELKYRTKPLDVQLDDGTTFSLTDQSAQDWGRYEFLRDVKRLEDFGAQEARAAGFAILLTNDPSYWGPGRKRQPLDSAFRLQHGTVIPDTLSWPDEKPYRGKAQYPIKLGGKYVPNWRPYYDYEVADRKYGVFKYLLINVPCSSSD